MGAELALPTNTALFTGTGCELRFVYKLPTDDISAASHETDTQM